MTDIVDRAKAALEGVTDGPWVVVGYGNIHHDPVGTHPPVAKAWNRANMNFIVAARSLLPGLIEEVEQLRPQFPGRITTTEEWLSQYDERPDDSND